MVNDYNFKEAKKQEGKRRLFCKVKSIQRNAKDLATQKKESHGQATKSARGMPWHWEPKKDATNCDKLRGAVSGH